MNDRLDNLRLFFPAEVTGSYLAVQGLMKANKIGPSEEMWYMLGLAIVLTVINAAIYFKFHKVTSWLLHFIIAIGLMIWIVNIDLERFKDLPWLGLKIEITGPTLLILYTLLTLFFQLPMGEDDEITE